jgi:hypothetical protein
LLEAYPSKGLTVAASEIAPRLIRSSARWETTKIRPDPVPKSSCPALRTTFIHKKRGSRRSGPRSWNSGDLVTSTSSKLTSLMRPLNLASKPMRDNESGYALQKLVTCPTLGDAAQISSD